MILAGLFLFPVPAMLALPRATILDHRECLAVLASSGLFMACALIVVAVAGS